MTKKIIGIIIAEFMILSLAACGAAKTSDNGSVETLSTAHGGSSQIESQSSQSSSNDSSTASANVSSSGAIDATDLFTDRDMKQTADTSEATNYSLSDGKDITITSAGVYVFPAPLKTQRSSSMREMMTRCSSFWILSPSPTMISQPSM